MIFTNYYYFSALIFSIAIGGVTYSKLYYVLYVMQGSYGSFFGLIAGPLGIGCDTWSRETYKLVLKRCGFKFFSVFKPYILIQSVQNDQKSKF